MCHISVCSMAASPATIDREALTTVVVQISILVGKFTCTCIAIKSIDSALEYDFAIKK